jgi:hypothetical protein
MEWRRENDIDSLMDLTCDQIYHEKYRRRTECHTREGHPGKSKIILFILIPSKLNLTNSLCILIISNYGPLWRMGRSLHRSD